MNHLDVLLIPCAAGLTFWIIAGLIVIRELRRANRRPYVQVVREDTGEYDE